MPSTIDYNMFKTTGYNRAINQNNVNRLIKSISAHNMLEQHPIIVNENFEVIDGQHRLAACRKLKIPCYFTVAEGYKPIDMILLNTNSLQWLARDYLNYFVAQGNINYIYLRDLQLSTGRPLSFILALCGYGSHKGAYTKFNEGKFIYPTGDRLDAMLKVKDNAQEVINLMRRCIKSTNNFTNTTMFNKAIVCFCSAKDFEVQVMLDKIPLRPDWIRHSGSCDEILKSFYEVYNFKKHCPLPVMTYAQLMSEERERRDAAAAELS